MQHAAEREESLRFLKRMFRFFADTQTRGRSPVYTALGEAIAEDDDVLAYLLDSPPEQRRPSLLLASVRFLLRREPDAPLAAYYPVCGGGRAVDGELPRAFREFCARHADELRELLRSRATQTNEIRRCLALRLGLVAVARHWRGPLSLVEVGASAGLNLLFDSYAYAVDGHATALEPPGGSPVVVVRSRVRGTGALDALSARLPAIDHRLGVDRDPVDLADEDARRWLEAFVWPEQVEELDTLRGAMALSAHAADAKVARGDALTDTARIVSDVPGDGPVVVFTASLLSYLDAGARAGFTAQLTEAARRRRVAWLFAEAPGLVARTDVDVPALRGPLGRAGRNYATGVNLRDGAGHVDELLALADPYFSWIAPARRDGDDFAWASDEGLC